MDTTGFFQYPTESALPAGLPGFLDQRGEDDWAALLEHADTRLFRPGEVVIEAGENDRALYLLVDGWLKAPSGVIHPITTVGEAAFLDGRPRAVTVRALTDGELLRLSFDALRGARRARSRARPGHPARRRPHPVGAPARRGRQEPGVDGLMAAQTIAFPNYTQIPRRLPVAAWRAIRAGSLVAAVVVAGLLVAVPDTGLFVMWKVVIPLLPLTFMVAPGHLAQHLPAGGVQPDAARARAHARRSRRRSGCRSTAT